MVPSCSVCSGTPKTSWRSIPACADCSRDSSPPRRHDALRGRGPGRETQRGKSTLLNALVGEHLAIVSPKPQSTRLPVVGLLTRDDAQFIFTDSPGLLEPEYKLHETMRAAALRAIADADVIAYLHPLSDFPAPPLTEVAKLDRLPKAPIVTVYTKADVVPPSDRPTVRSE